MTKMLMVKEITWNFKMNSFAELNLKYFWTQQEDLPSGIGFPLFGVKHIFALIVCIMGITALCHYARRCSYNKQNKILQTIALLMVVLEGLKDSYLTLIGRMGVGYLPLHLCSISIFVFLLYSFLPRTWFSDYLGEVGLVLLMPGAVTALVFPDWTMYPIVNYMSLHSFVWHSLIIAYPLILNMTGRIHPRFKHIWYPVSFLCVVVPLIFLFDIKTRTNYFFINVPLNGTPLEWMYEEFGAYWRVAYAVTILAVIVLVYLILECIHKLKIRQ